MNWYKKAKFNRIASLDVYVSGFSRDSKFDSIYWISCHLRNQLFNKWMDKNDYNYFKEFNVSVPGSDVITIDGTNVDDPTGTINFYTEGIPPSKIPIFVNNMVDFFKSNNMKIGNIKQDTSKMYNVPVIRIPVLSNPKAEQVLNENKPPEVNMANNNAFFIFNTILKYNRNLWEENRFDATELKKRIEYYEGETKLQEGEHAGQPFIKLSPKDLFDQSPESYDILSGKSAMSNYDEPMIRFQLNNIKEICNWAINNGYKELYLA